MATRRVLSSVLRSSVAGRCRVSPNIALRISTTAPARSASPAGFLLSRAVEYATAPAAQPTPAPSPPVKGLGWKSTNEFTGAGATGEVCQEALSSHNGWLGLYGNMPLAARTLGNRFGIRCLTTADHYEELSEENSASIAHDALPQRIKVKRPDKTARHIMNILDKEAVEKANAGKVIPDVRAGYIIELKVEAPENKGRVSTIKGLVIGRKNAGISTSIRVRRMESNVGVETVFPLYSPNIKSIKVLERRSVRRAKLFYIRDKPFNVALRELAQRTAKKKEMVQKSSKKHQSKK